MRRATHAGPVGAHLETSVGAVSKGAFNCTYTPGEPAQSLCDRGCRIKSYAARAPETRQALGLYLCPRSGAPLGAGSICRQVFSCWQEAASLDLIFSHP